MLREEMLMRTVTLFFILNTDESLVQRRSQTQRDQMREEPENS